MIFSLVNSIKALAECKIKPESLKGELDDEIIVIDETHNLKQMELEDEIIIIDEIKPKQLQNSNVCRKSDKVKIQPEYKNKDGEDIEHDKVMIINGSFENKMQFLKCTECDFRTTSELKMEIHKGCVHKNKEMLACNKKTNVRVKSINCTQCQTNVEHETCLASQENKSFEKETKSTQHFCKSCKYMTTTAIYFRKPYEIEPWTKFYFIKYNCMH